MKIIDENNKTRYQCEECGFLYEEQSWAEKCEAWCIEHQSFNIEIITRGISPKQKEI